ncbi:MAG TPA: aminopeptidase P family protein, partial [Anaerolineales bacterium]|nr:aminopeptidase P family protein [Anaerolineales bacterium]
EPTTWQNVFNRALQNRKIEAFGIEDMHHRLLEYRYLQSALPQARIQDAGEVVASLRMYKDESEEAAMQQAVNIAEAALKAALSQAKIGMTEKELASELVLQLLRHGSEGDLPFQPIISTGPNGANPHAFPSDRKLAAGELVVIDFGATFMGYYSDITRTFGIGELSDEQIKVHKTVQEANAAGRAAVRPGAACHDVDKAARDVIDAAGYGDFFIHRTGHGLGMETHEEPYMRAGNPMLLEPGMSFTIEPGIYLPNRFGVRIEDNVVVTADGLTSLTTYPRAIEIIGG